MPAITLVWMYFIIVQNFQIGGFFIAFLWVYLDLFVKAARIFKVNFKAAAFYTHGLFI